MSVLLGPNGRPISSKDFTNKKATPPPLGERYGSWSGNTMMPIASLPGGGAIAFDLTKLNLSDFRQMRSHYQINSSLSVLTFMLHQIDWHIESPSERKAELVERQLRNVWSRLVRSMAQSFWAGYSPNVLQWENDYVGREVVLTKIKDLYPEDCSVRWKEIKNPLPGGPPGSFTSHKVYDGINQWGAPAPIPVDNSFWYPILMENGNYEGRRLLESAFQPWFFSLLLHLFANRYYERFGEPTPVGRAPFDETLDLEDGKSIRGNQAMALMLEQLRNRSAVVLPSTRTLESDTDKPDYDYQIEYLESQMRGADFERYMTRLDEEMSLAMFTPILMMRTADVGSYNLGTQHTQVYQWMLNAISGDWAHYINKYIIRPIVHWNFNGQPDTETRIVFTKMGKTSNELLQAVITQLLASGKIKFDTREIGEMCGLTVTEVNEVVEEEDVPPAEEETDPTQEDAQAELKRLISKRVAAQVEKGFSNGNFGTLGFQPKLGYKRQLAVAMRRDGVSNVADRVDDMYDALDSWLGRTVAYGIDEYGEPGAYMAMFNKKLDGCFAEFIGV